MRIIIAGAGEVGTHLAKMLSKENHTIILLDENGEKIKALEANYDILGIEGLPTSLKDLREAQAGSADLFVAVTPYESTNITACLLATNLGAKKTLARIDNHEYLLPKNVEFFQRMGVDSLIYPEMLAANEIVNALKRGWVRQYVEFSDGALVLLAAKLRDNAPIVNQTIEEAFKGNTTVRILLIKRQGKDIIAKGKDTILSGDIVYFMTTKDGIDEVREKAGKEDFEINNIMILGGGSRVGVRAIKALSRSKNIKVIEHDKDKALRLIENTENVLVINGDGRDLEMLKNEDIESIDAFVALTGNAETNILACLAAKSFGVRRTVAEVENLDYIPLAENLNIGSIINKKSIAASHIYKLILGRNVANVRCLTLSDVEVVEFMAGEQSSIVKAPIKDIRLPDNVNIGGIIRNGVGFVPLGTSHIHPGDNVLVFCAEDTIRKVEKLFK
ncbi:MAG: Trk system potassium transporter TrkA [Paludibacteraceae bacterium]|nr:Trk system potassium transporter TrkA [Paludibacteraceae bacterium]